MKIIYDSINRTLRINEKTNESGLQELDFYIPKGFSYELFLIIKNIKTNSLDVLELKRKTNEHGKYYIYSVPPDVRVSFDVRDTYSISLLYFDKDTMPIISMPVEIVLDFSQFKTISNIYFIQKAKSDIGNYYQKIMELTQLNIDLYKKIGGEDE